jgi:hypothetical protein
MSNLWCLSSSRRLCALELTGPLSRRKLPLCPPRLQNGPRTSTREDPTRKSQAEYVSHPSLTPIPSPPLTCSYDPANPPSDNKMHPLPPPRHAIQIPLPRPENYNQNNRPCNRHHHNPPLVPPSAHNPAPKALPAHPRPPRTAMSPFPPLKHLRHNHTHINEAKTE